MEDGVHTYDIFKDGTSKEKVGTKEFANAVVARLGQVPQTLKAVKYAAKPPQQATKTKAEPAAAKEELVGIDVYIEWPSRNPNELAAVVGKASGDGLTLELIANRGVKVWPDGSPETFCTDNFRCRFKSAGVATKPQIGMLMARIMGLSLEVGMTVTLRTFDGKAGFTLAQGQ
jgi:isocitrate dehydrogenase